MRSLLAAIVACVTFCNLAAAQQTYPNRNVTIVVPFGVGSSVDIFTRAMAQYLRTELGQPFVVVNRPGAGGNIGAASVAHAQPDGYTILMATTGPAANNKFMYKDMAFDPDKDFEAVALIGTAPIIIATRPDAPFKTLKDMVAYAKANPDKLNAGYPGNGSLGHITGELIKSREGLKFGTIQYKGSGEIVVDLIGGQIDLAMDSIAPYVAQVKEGKLRALAIGSRKRFEGLPDVPTTAEAGFPSLEASVFYAMLTPHGTPADIVSKLNKAANDYLKTDAAIKILGGAGIQPNQSTPAEAKKYIAAEAAKWEPVIKGANIKF
ncbi:MAG: tripartite tricarboxylate transporter substrate binding protein [Proteobacteria bacterium]|nr:tripartite tricarboxylate transporter substrate binding protein [Pseudomonadota bacterium]